MNIGYTNFSRVLPQNKGVQKFQLSKSINTKSCSSNPTFLQENHIYKNQVNFWQNKMIWKSMNLAFDMYFITEVMLTRTSLVMCMTSHDFLTLTLHKSENIRAALQSLMIPKI